jgi:hypothetical protein
MEVARFQLHWLLEARCAAAGAHTHTGGVVGNAWVAAEAEQPAMSGLAGCPNLECYMT